MKKKMTLFNTGLLIIWFLTPLVIGIRLLMSISRKMLYRATLHYLCTFIVFNAGAMLVAFSWLSIMVEMIDTCEDDRCRIRKMITNMLMPIIVWMLFIVYVNITAFGM